MNVQQLRARLAELTAQAEGIQAKATGETRALTSEEQTQLTACFDEFNRLDTELQTAEQIERMQTRHNEAAQSAGRRSAAGVGQQAPPAAAAQAANGGLQYTILRTQEERNRWGWTSMGEFAVAVRNANTKDIGTVDPRFRAAASTYGSEAVSEDGGMAVPPDFRTAIMEKVLGEESLASRCDIQLTGSNKFSCPQDTTPVWDSTGGIQAYWEGEADPAAASKFKGAPFEVRVNKLMALVPVTEENLEDAPALESYLRKRAPEAIEWKLNDAIFNGNGAGKPLGILQCPALITVTKETSQPNGTVQAKNLAKMWSRIYAPWRRNAVWIINQDVEPQLPTLGVELAKADGTVVGMQSVFVPAGGFSGAPYSSLYNRPVIAHQVAKSIGTPGDVTLIDFRQYCLARKAQGLKMDTSIHLYFDQAITAFRFQLRVGGRPWWDAAITPANGSNTLGFAAVISAR